MRLKEDSSSWKARGIKRRDSRNDKSQPLNEKVTPVPSVKKKKPKHVHQLCKNYLRTNKSWREDVDVYEFVCPCGFKAQSVPYMNSVYLPRNSVVVSVGKVKPHPTKE